MKYPYPLLIDQSASLISIYECEYRILCTSTFLYHFAFSLILSLYLSLGVLCMYVWCGCGCQ